MKKIVKQIAGKPRERPIKAWAIFEGNRMAVFDYRLPIGWRREPTTKLAKKMCVHYRIARILITEIR